MEEVKTTELQKTQQEYVQKCAELGNLKYQICMLEKELPKLIDEMQKLNNKGAYLKDQQAAKEKADKELSNGN